MVDDSFPEIEVVIDRDGHDFSFIVADIGVDGRPYDTIPHAIQPLIDHLDAEDGVTALLKAVVDPYSSLVAQTRPDRFEAAANQYTLTVTDDGYDVTYNGDAVDLSEYDIETEVA